MRSHKILSLFIHRRIWPYNPHGSPNNWTRTYYCLHKKVYTLLCNPARSCEMTIILLILLVSLITLSLIRASSPLMIALYLFSLAVSISIFLYTSSSWLSLTLFLIYVGGVIVIFSYFVAITPPSEPLTPTTPIPIVALALILALPLDIVDSQHTLTLVTTQVPHGLIINTPLLIIFLAWVLLLILVVVVKTATRGQGTLRPHL